MPADALHVQAQSGAVRSLHERGLTWVSFEPMPNLACRLDFALRKFPDLGLLSGVVQGVRHEHTCQDSGDGKDDFSFHMNLAGLSIVAGRRGETTLRDGDAMLLSYSASRTISRPEPVDHRVIRLPRASLGPLVRNIDDAVLRPIPRGTGMLSLLRNYVDALFDDPALAMPEMRQLVRRPTLRSRRGHPRRDARCSRGCRGSRHTRGSAARHQERHRSTPRSRRSFARCGCEAPEGVGQLHPQTVRGRRNVILASSCSPAGCCAHTAC